MKISCLRRALIALSACLPMLAMSQPRFEACGALANGTNGPYDYRVVRGRELKVVEDFHFNTKVENLLGGQTGELGDDLTYVLRVFPNHHRALVSISRLSVRLKTTQVPKAAFTTECFYERALRFQPDDTVARTLYANYLNDLKRPDEAVRQLDRVIELAKDNPFTQYNVGLVFFQMKQYERAVKQAHLAEQMGFTRPDLKQMLQAAGKWVDPDERDKPSSTAAPASAPAASAASQSQT